MPEQEEEPGHGLFSAEELPLQEVQTGTGRNEVCAVCSIYWIYLSKHEQAGPAAA